MKDLFGTEIKVGNVVAMVQPAYKDLRLGTVTQITPCKVRVKWTCHNKWEHNMLREPNQIIVNPRGAS